MPAKNRDELEEIDFEIDEIDFTVVDDIKAEYVDERDYVDKCFNDFSREQGSKTKSVRRIYQNDNSEPEINPGEVAAILRYKAQPAKGRKNPLAGYDVLHVSLPTGSLRIPLDQAEKFGKYLISAARSVIKHVEVQKLSQTNDNQEK